MKLNPEYQLNLTDAVIEQTADQFGIEPISWEVVPEGIAHAVARLTCEDGDYYAKYYSSNHEPLRVNDEVMLVNLLLRNLLAVPHYVEKKVDGTTVGSIEGESGSHALTVTRAIKGTHPHLYSPAIIQDLAQNHAAFHQLANQLEVNTSLNLRRDYHFYEPKAEESAIVDIDNVCKRLFSVIEEKWDELPSGAVHLDIARTNILVEGDELTAVIDFEDTSRAPFVFCLAGTLWDILEETTNANMAKIENYVDNYEAVSPLESIEKQLLMPMIKLRGWIALHGALLTQGPKSQVASNGIKSLSAFLINY